MERTTQTDHLGIKARLEDLLEMAKKYKGSNPRYTRVASAWLLMGTEKAEAFNVN